MNLFEYGLNDPTLLRDPLGLFPTWWHQKWTYQIAQDVFGPKCKEKARIVADANAAVDALPTLWDKVTFLFGNNGWEYGGPHFPLFNTVQVMEENAVRTCDLKLLGRATHSVQDMYAHWPGVWGPFVHHVTFSTMDWGAILNHEYRAGPALDETRDLIQEFKDKCLRCCD